MATQSCSSSGKGSSSSIIEIEVTSATLITKEEGKFYVRISISKSQELQTKVVKCSKPDYNPPSWNQKFVFSVPGHFVFDDKSEVSFTVFRERRYFSDIPVGKVRCEMKALFPNPIDEYKKDENRSYQGEATYDTDHEDDDDGEFREPEIQARGTFELKAVVGVPILKESCVVGTLNISIAAWEKYYPYELNLNGRARKNFAIFRDSEKVGSMILQKAKQERYVSFVGNVKWRHLAMEFDELMMQKGADQKRPKKSLGICFATGSNSTID